LVALWAAGAIALGGCSGDSGTPAEYDPIELALVRVIPADGESSVPRNSLIRMEFNTTVLPSSVHDQSIRVRTGGTFSVRPEGGFLVSGNVVEFDPRVTRDGLPHAIGFDAGVQVLVDVPLYLPDSNEPKVNYLQNVEGNPILYASGDNRVTFATGMTWDDPVPGAPGVLGLAFTPAPNEFNQVPPQASVTVIFDEPVDPATVILGKNIFLTNNTETAASYQQSVPSVTFYDGSLTRFTFLPVFGFGQGPYNMKVNFIDPIAPETFDPVLLPKDLGGNEVINFTYLETFDTQFDPVVEEVGLLTEDFTTLQYRDASETDALWGGEPSLPYVLLGAPIIERVVDIDVLAIVSLGGGSTVIGTGGQSNNDYCPSVDPLVGPGAPLIPNVTPSLEKGRRQMNLYRPEELQGDGTIVRAAWGPDSDATFAATYDDVIVRFGHHRAGTGLYVNTFDSQYDVDGFVTAASKVLYSVPQASDVNGGNINDGYLDWPDLDTFFDYNGVDGLIIDVEARMGTTWQQFRTFIGVRGGGAGVCSCTNFMGCRADPSLGWRQLTSTYGGKEADPQNSPTGLGIFNPGPFVHVMQFELAKLRSDAQSLFYNSGTDAPDYVRPIISPNVQPGGASVSFTWQGSNDGVNPAPEFWDDEAGEYVWAENINACDGFRYIRFHAILHANLFTGARPIVQLVEIPYYIPY
jgi:hypothetical protein